MKAEETINYKVSEGKCVKCESEELDYKAVEIRDKHLFYPYTCTSCGVEAKEYYLIKYWASISEDDEARLNQPD